MKSKIKWDLFISHASEDKEQFVKPLAKLLESMGVTVWYDEFSLKFGDSLSRSIDKGLNNSRFGIIIISRAFIAKRWPEYELQGLVTLERSGKRKRIIPIWHGVSRKEVMSFSPTLADKIAGDSSRLSLSQIAFGIVEVVRPDLFHNYQRLALLKHMLNNSVTKQIPLSKIVLDTPIIHATLPSSMLVRIHIIHKIFHEVFPQSLEEAIDDFRREQFAEKELQVWERMAAAYLYLTQNRAPQLEEKKEIFIALLDANCGSEKEYDFTKFHFVTPQMIQDALNILPPSDLEKNGPLVIKI